MVLEQSQVQSMGFIKRALTNNQVRKDAELLAEEKLYEYVGNEIDSGEIRPGLCDSRIVG